MENAISENLVTVAKGWFEDKKITRRQLNAVCKIAERKYNIQHFGAYSTTSGLYDVSVCMENETRTKRVQIVVTDTEIVYMMPDNDINNMKRRQFRLEQRAHALRFLEGVL